MLGLGEIGRCVAATCSHLGMSVTGLVRSIPPPDKQLPSVTYCTMDSLPELLKNSDYICNVLPSTAATRGMLGGGVLAECKPNACFINVGRGDIIPESELVSALEQRVLAGAILDVFETEPLPKESRLWALPNVVITPHESALSFPHQVAENFAENFNRFVDDPSSLLFQVDVSSGY